MSQQDAFDRALASLYEATLNDVRWPAAAALIEDACGTRGSTLVVGKGRSQEDLEIFLARVCYHGERYEVGEQLYFNDYYPIDEGVPRVVQLPDSRLAHMTDLYTADELKTSPVYNDALAYARYQNGLTVRLDGPDGSSIVWSLADPTNPGGWWPEQTAMIENFLPHIRQFIRVRQALAAAEALGVSLTALFHNTWIGVIHLDRRGRIVETNHLALGHLRRGDGLSDQGGFLCAGLPEDHARLERLLARALPVFGRPAVSGSMTVRRSPGLPSLVIHINPVAHGELDLDTRRVAVLVLVVEPGSHPPIDPSLVATSLGLTPAESHVAVSLASGRSVRDIARATGRQENSVRFLLKKIYDKRGISRQADLVRLVLSVARFSVTPR